MSAAERYDHDGAAAEATRQMPANFEAEQALLGAMLVDNSAYHRVGEFLRAEHFADPLHGRIYEASARLIERSQVVNPITLKPWFERDEAFIDVSADRYLARLAGAAISIIDVSDYGRQIHELFLRRQLIEIGAEIVNQAYEPPAEAATELVAAAEAKLFSIAENGAADDRMRDARTSLDETFDVIDDEMRQLALPEEERRANRITTGIDGLDDKLRIRPGNVVYIAGATSSGKSALADCIAEHNERQGVPTAIFAWEMLKEEWNIRRLARVTGINAHYIEGGTIRQDEYVRLDTARRELAALPYYIDDTPGLSPSQLKSRLRRLVRRFGVRLAIVDYLQLMRSDRTERRAGTRAEEIGQHTRALKIMAQELGVALIVLSQINRGVNQRDDKRPDLSDLRESGSIEQDANAVIFIYREEYYLARGKPVGKGGKPPSAQESFDYEQRLDDVRGLAEIIVAKQRQGVAPFTVKTRFDGARFRFTNLVESKPAGPPPAQSDLLEGVPA